MPFETGPAPYLAFPGGVYTVNFAQRTIKPLLTPVDGETVLWAIRWKDEKHQLTQAFVGTNKSVHIVNETGTRTFSAPVTYDLENHGTLRVGRLDNPQRFVVWYEPSWHLRPAAIKTMPSYLVEYDAAGRAVAGRQVPHRPLVKPSSIQVLFGLVTSMAEAAVLVGTTEDLFSETRSKEDKEVRPLPFLLVEIILYFIPGLGLDRVADASPIRAFVGLILVSAVICAIVCFLLARRYALSRVRCIGWSLCGFLFGPTGLLLMLAVQEWPARIACPNCRKPRVVTRDTCEHCEAAHALPAPDGTEIFESTGGNLRAALFER